ncbi:MAG: hypothetical protein QW056_04780 [Candidatus Bathyarchaeia archaeon]
MSVNGFMLKHIRVVPLAAESLGVRSMCCLVESPDIRILLDAGVSLCPNRFGLVPHPLEYQAIIKCRARIAKEAEGAEVVTVSHYHYDHYTPSFEDWLCNWTEEEETSRQIYQDKTVIAKNPREKINFSQRRRGWLFKKTISEYARSFEIADGRSFTFGRTILKFSEPVFHGSENSPMGWVLMTTIEYEGEKFLHAPDVQGPISQVTLEMILGIKPNLAMIGGPPLYLAGFRVPEEEIQHALKNIERIVENVPAVVLEHHMLRDEGWREKAVKIFEAAEQAGHKVLTAAELAGERNTLLEAARKRLYAENPPSREFERWMRSNRTGKRRAKPPL